MATEDASAPLVERTLGDFRLREQIGAGGFGDVYLADQLALGREAIVKVLRGGSHERFVREATLASKLDHPYAAHIYAFGAEPDGTCWIAMEHVRGSSLRALLEAQGTMPLERFVPLLERICEVVHTAHEQGIVHCDLKPDNVMVISRAGRLLPKLLDFGIARVVAERAERPSDEAIAGSPLYMAPELWLDPNGASRATDQYALAALAYEALTGRFAFPGRTVKEIARAHARPARKPLGGGLPIELDRTLDKALARRAAERFANVLELAQAFRDASGVGKTALELPHLDDQLRRAHLARAPQPIADAVASYDAAKNAHQAREALRGLARVAGWYVGLVALACRTRIGGGVGEDARAVRELLRDLRRHDLTPAGWIGLARLATKPFVRDPDTYPIPELVLLLHPATGVDPFTAILQGTLSESLPDSSEEAAAQAIARELPTVNALLRGTAFLLDYQLVVPHGDRADVWMGARTAQRRTMSLARPLVDDHPTLVDDAGAPVLALWPLVQVATPIPGHGEHVFFLAGPGQRGARLVSAPHGFEHWDPGVWEWFREQLFDDASGDAGRAAGPSPYRGLASYTAADAASFFGREREVETFVNRLRVEPFALVVGPSGVGKSSFVHAGVAPALGRRVVTMRPGRAPLAELGHALGIDVDEDGVVERVRAAGDVLIVVDQLEELFTLGCATGERDAFLRVLSALARSDAIRIVATLRDDFLIRAQQLPGLAAVLARGLQLLGPLGADELERVLVEPARRAGFAFEDAALPKAMVAEVAGAPAAVALISFAANRLWELRDRHFHQLTRKAHDAIGGVTGALARHADDTVDAMPAGERAIVRRAFRHLVTADGTRAVLARDELEQLLGGGPDVGRAIERLVEARLLTTREEAIEIVHETLVTQWPRLVEWRNEDIEGSRFHEQLRAAARQWHDRGRPRGLLWRGDALAEYQLWQRRRRPNLTPQEHAFAAASVADAVRGRAIRRALIAVAALATAVFVVVLWRANVSANRAREDAQDLLRDSYLEQGRLRVLEGDKLAALPALASAYGMGANDEATRLLIEEALAPTRARLRSFEHADKVWDVAYSPDGKRVASASSDSTARLWDAETGALETTVHHASRVLSVAVSPDGALLASASDEAIILTSIAERREVARLPSTRSPLVRFSHDGRLLFGLGRDRALIVYAVADRAPHPIAHPAPIGAAFCAAADCLLAWSADGKISVWDTATFSERAHVEAKPPLGLAGAISRTGKLIAVGGETGSVFLFGGDGTPLATIAAHEQSLIDVAISPDETLVATAALDRVARVWTAAGAPRAVLAGHRGNVTSARFVGTGDRIVTTSADGTARVWTTSGMQLDELAGHANTVMAGAIRGDGARLATASWDHRVMTWRLDGDQAFRPIATTGPIAFDRSGDRVATAEGPTLFVTDARRGTRICEHAHGAPIAQVAWSPDGDRLVASVPSARRIDVLDGRSCTVVHALSHEHAVGPIAIGPGDRVATAEGASAHLWSRDGTRERDLAYPADVLDLSFIAGRLVGTTLQPAVITVDAPGEHASFTGPMPFVAIDADEARGWLIGGSVDQTMRIWDLATGAEVRKLEASGPVQAVAVTPDKALHVALGGMAPTVWDAASGAVVRHLEGHTALVMGGGMIGERTLLAISDRKAFVWDIVAGRKLFVIEDVDQVSIAPDRRTVALIGPTGTRLWSVRSDAPTPGTLEDLHFK